MILKGGAKVILKPRLAGVASLIPSGTVVADIGTDHAYLPLYLVKENKSPRVIAVEKSEHNCRLARETISLLDLEGKVELRVGDGLLALREEDEVEIVAIAGLGGRTICKLLIAAGSSLQNYKRLVLQPMTAAHFVRRWLVAHNYYFFREKLARENNRFYEIIAAEKGKEMSSDPLLLELGPALLRDKDPLLIPWLEYKLRRYEKLIEGLLRSKSGKDDPRWSYYSHRYDSIKGVYKDVCQRQ
jgi:tRNA (adenine22-N1)-methyltransferase